MPSVVQAAALDGIEEFSHVWLIWDFHENTNSTTVLAKTKKARGDANSSKGDEGKSRNGSKVKQVKAKIHPPGLSGAKVGLFATRTPHRPNPIGLSLCRLISVEGKGDRRDTLILGGADIVDGTPILDVKPYLAHDRIDGDGRGEGALLRVPAWCTARTDSSLLREVRFEPVAEEALRMSLETIPNGDDGMRFYRGSGDAFDLRSAISEALLLDIRSVHQGRGKSGEGQQYRMRLDALEITFGTFETHVLVTGISLYH